MDPRMRAKFLRVIDGDPRLMTTAYYIHEHRQCERILDWCIVNRVTGSELIRYMQFNGNSILNTIREIIRRIEKDGAVRPIIVGVDIRR
jgi:hypothetical protein